MSFPSDKPVQAASSDGGTHGFMAVLIGSLLGNIAGDMSGSIAKLFLYFRKGENYEMWRLTEVSLVVILVFTFLILIFGVYSTKRGWAKEEQIVLSVMSAFFVALATMIDQSLPGPNGGGDITIFLEQFYSISWVFGLWLITMVIIPNANGLISTKIRLGGRLIALSAAMALVCGIVGIGLTEFIRDSIRDSEYLKMIRYSSDCHICRDPLKFWLLRPSSLNPIWGMFFVLAFLPIWWKDLWQHIKIVFARTLWIVLAVAFAMLYSGLYGWKLFPSDKQWAEKLMNSNLISQWDFFFAFGAFPATGAIVVLICFWLTRRKIPINKIGWPISNRFWWFLPVGFAVGFATTARLVIAPIISSDGASTEQINFLTFTHGINGAVLGLTLLAFIPMKKILLPEIAWMSLIVIELSTWH